MPVPVIVAIISGVTSVIVAAINADWLPVTFRYERWWYNGWRYNAQTRPVRRLPPQASVYPLLISDVPKGGDIHGWSWQLHSRRSGWHSSGRWGRLIRTWFQYMEVIFMGSVLGTIIRAIFDAAADPACRDWSGLFPWKEVIKLKKFSFSGIYSERWWYHEQDHKSRSSARRFSAPLVHFLVIFLWFHIKEVIFMSAGVLTAIIGAAASIAIAAVNSQEWFLISWFYMKGGDTMSKIINPNPLRDDSPLRWGIFWWFFSDSTLRRWFSWVQAYLPPLSALLLLSLPRSSIPILMTERPFRAGGGDNHAAFFAGKRLTFRDKCAKLYL